MKINKTLFFQAATVLLAISLVAVLAFGKFGCTGAAIANLGSGEKIGEDTVKFLNTNFDSTAVLKKTEVTGGIYKFDLDVQGQETSVYATADGSLIFPIAIDTTEKLDQPSSAQTQTAAVTCDDMDKTDAPSMTAFVVSYCPFGLQMQRILYQLPSDVRAFVDVKYIGDIADGKITSMHGDQEATENLRQICIREEQSDKFWNYLGCFMKEGNVTSCLSSEKIDTKKLDTCMNGTKGIEYATKDFELADSLNVQGSPTLVLNGKTLDERGITSGFGVTMRSPELYKQAICCSLTKEVTGCSQELSITGAATAFSTEASGSSGSDQPASC